MIGPPPSAVLQGKEATGNHRSPSFPKNAGQPDRRRGVGQASRTHQNRYHLATHPRTRYSPGCAGGALGLQKYFILLYAAHDIPEVWLVDLKNRRVTIYREPGPEGYKQVTVPEQDQVLAPVLLPDLKIKFSELWQ